MELSRCEHNILIIPPRYIKGLPRCQRIRKASYSERFLSTYNSVYIAGVLQSFYLEKRFQKYSLGENFGGMGIDNGLNRSIHAHIPYSNKKCSLLNLD